MPTYYTVREDELLKLHYRREGPLGMTEYLPERSIDSIRHRATKLGLTSIRGRGPAKPAEEDFKRLIAQIPRDTRDITGRMLGDPLPGRSALDRLSNATGGA